MLLSRAWRAAAAAGFAFVATLGGGPVHALAAGQSSTPGQQMAAALRSSPLYVDPSLRSAFPPAVRASLLREMSRAPAHVFVLAVPLPVGGEWRSGDQLATVVHDYLGRPGVYLTLDAQLSNEIDAYTWPSDPYGADAGPYNAADAALAVNLAAGTRDAALGQKFLSCVELISDGQAVPAYRAALRHLDVPPVAPAAPGTDPVVLALIVIALTAAALAAAGAAAWLLRSRRGRLPGWLLRWRGAQPPGWLLRWRGAQPPAWLLRWRGARPPAWLGPAWAAIRSGPARRLLARARGGPGRVTELPPTAESTEERP